DPASSQPAGGAPITVDMAHADQTQAPVDGENSEQRSFLGDIGRQVGLTARHGLEGVGQVAGMLSEPIRQGLNVGLRAAGLPQAAPAVQVAAAGADALGLPTPENATDRVVGDVTQIMAGAGGIMGGAGAL